MGIYPMASNPYDQFDTNPYDQFDESAGSPINPRRYTNPNRNKSAMELAGRGALNFGRDASLGLSQLAAGVAEKLGVPGAADERAALEGIADVRRMDPTLRSTAGKVGYTAAALVPAVGTAFIPGANTVTGGAAIGAGMGLMQPTGTGESRGWNALVGGAAGAAGQGLAKGISKIAQPITRTLSGAEDDAVRLLQQEGVPLRPGQQTGSRAAKATERFLADNPVSAPRMERAAQQQARGFTKATLRSIGVNADEATPAVLGPARTRITGVLDQIESKYVPDVQAMAPDLAIVKGDAGLLSQYGAPILRIIDDLEQTAQAGTLTGKLVAKYRTALGRLSRDPYVGGLAHDLDEVLQNGMQQAMQGTDDFARYATARTQYRNLKSIESAVQNVADAQVPAGTLASRLASSRFTRNSFKYGTGDQQLAELARAGSTVIDRTPNSGTSMRAAAQFLPAGLAALYGYGKEGNIGDAALYGAGALALPWAGSRLMTNPMTANYLAQGLSGPARGLLAAPGYLPIGPMAAAGLLTQP